MAQRNKPAQEDEDLLNSIAPTRKARRNSSTRASKVAAGEQKVIKDKFQEQRQVPPLRPMNDRQADYINLINTKSLVIATGFAGTSKTYIPTVMACTKWRKGEIDKIYLSRPAVSESKSLGYFRGDEKQKLSLWLLPVLSTMYDQLGRNVVDLAIAAGDITFVPLETIKGLSFGKNTFVIVDEAEDVTAKEAKSIVTRQGGGTMVLCGDLEQSCLDERSGLAWLVKMVEKYPHLGDTTGFVDFNRPSDIVRSEACRAWILAMRKEV